MNNLQEKVIRAMVDMYGFYSIEELSEMTEISISSIKRSLKDITKFIEDYDGKLLRVPKKGICMVVTDQREKIFWKHLIPMQMETQNLSTTERITF